MSAHSTTYMNNGHTLTVTEDTDGRTFHVIERDETGGLVHIYPCDSLAQANAMVEERAPAEVRPGYGLGRLEKHTVREHEDGTITVAPGDGSSNSILVTKGAGGPSWHGYIERGVFREA